MLHDPFCLDPVVQVVGLNDPEPFALQLIVAFGELPPPVLAVQVVWELTAIGLGEQLTLTLTAAARYGPTNGPPFPTGAAPAGSMNSVLVSASARARLIRPLPVCDCVPAGSALRARRPTMMPLVSVGSTAFMSAAAPATIAADVEVPLTVT